MFDLLVSNVPFFYPDRLLVKLPFFLTCTRVLLLPVLRPEMSASLRARALFFLRGSQGQLVGSVA